MMFFLLLLLGFVHTDAMYKLKKMLSNDPFADDKSDDLIRKTPSSRKPRVPAQEGLSGSSNGQNDQ